MCSTRRVPPVTTQLVGGGIMEWSPDRDRYLNVCEGVLFAAELCGTYDVCLPLDVAQSSITRVQQS